MIKSGIYRQGGHKDTLAPRNTSLFWTWTNIGNANGTLFLQSDGCTMNPSGAQTLSVVVHTNALYWENLSQVADLEPHKLGWEQFSVIPVTDKWAIQLMKAAKTDREMR